MLGTLISVSTSHAEAQACGEYCVRTETSGQWGCTSMREMLAHQLCGGWNYRWKARGNTAMVRASGTRQGKLRKLTVLVLSWPSVLVLISNAVKGRHDHGSSHKRKTFHWGGFHVQKFSPLSLWWDTLVKGRHGTGEVAECPTTWLAGNRKWPVLLGLAWAYIRPQNLPPQWHTFLHQDYSYPKGHTS